MKAANVLLGVLVMSLVACSNGGGGGNNGGGGMPDLKPGMKPANAVSKEDLGYYAQILEKSQSFLPADAVVFNVVLAGANAENVQPEDRNEAYWKLDPTGRQNIDTIKQNCRVLEAVSSTTGDQEFRVGAVSETTGTMGLNELAGRCPTLMTKSAYQKSTVRTIEQAGADSARIVTFVEGTDSRSQTIADARWQSTLNGTRMNMDFATSGTVEMTMSKDSMSMKADMSGNGSLSVDLLAGDFIRGPISMNLKMDTATQKGNMQALYDLQTVRGAIRIVMIGTEATQEFYINGEKVEPGQMGGLTNLIQTKMAPIVK